MSSGGGRRIVILWSLAHYDGYLMSIATVEGRLGKIGNTPLNVNAVFELLA
jgi:hypothetical protein